MPKTGEELTLDIIDVNNLGNGIAKNENLVFFVPKTLTKEKVLVQVINSKENYSNAKLLSVVEKSPKRLKSQCKYYDLCGGCQLLHLGYKDQIDFKKSHLLKTLNLSNVEVFTSKQFDYRNRIILHFGYKKAKRFLGFYQDSQDILMQIDKCLLVSNEVNEIIEEINQLLQNVQIDIYNPKTDLGLMKNLVIEYSESTKEILFTLVTNGKQIKEVESFCNQLIKTIKKVTLKNKLKFNGLIQNINKFNDSRIFGVKEKIYFGSNEINYNFMNLRITKNNQAFIQVNHEISAQIYQDILNFIEPKKIVIDLYCGIGILSILISQKAFFVYGIEINKSAISAANIIKQQNQIESVQFLESDSKVFLKNLLKDQIFADYLIIDPPRKGLDKDAIASIIKYKSPTLIYLSCNQITLKRDLDLLSSTYKIASIKAYDMFPNTYHLETLVILKAV